MSLTSEERRWRAIRRGLLLVPYAGAAMLPAAVVPAACAVAACLVASRAAGGLRAVVGSPALRRALASTDRALVAVHLVAPLAVTAVWTAAALPALLPIHPLAAVLLRGPALLGILVAAHLLLATTAMTSGCQDPS